jgi:hypothetical protein
MTRNSESLLFDVVNRQGADALLAATLSFLRSNKIPKQVILESIRENFDPKRPRKSTLHYKKLVRAYQDMGIVMSTWFSSSKFLDAECRPLPLTTRPGALSIASLVRTSRVSISTKFVIQLMRRSPSIRADAFAKFLALRREFVLPEFEVLRAALVVERYLDTLHRNSSPSKKKSFLLLERSCHVPEVNFGTIAPILRDIKRRGSAYLDSVNGDIESLRPRRARRNGTGEMSVHIFAWTRLSKVRKARRI